MDSTANGACMVLVIFTWIDTPSTHKKEKKVTICKTSWFKVRFNEDISHLQIDQKFEFLCSVDNFKILKRY